MPVSINDRRFKHPSTETATVGQDWKTAPAGSQGARHLSLDSMYKPHFMNEF